MQLFMQRTAQQRRTFAAAHASKTCTEMPVLQLGSLGSCLNSCCMPCAPLWSVDDCHSTAVFAFRTPGSEKRIKKLKKQKNKKQTNKCKIFAFGAFCFCVSLDTQGRWFIPAWDML